MHVKHVYANSLYINNVDSRRTHLPSVLYSPLYYPGQAGMSSALSIVLLCYKKTHYNRAQQNSTKRRCGKYESELERI